MSEVNKQERGRSMVEILGVLAVVGVLSAGGISGYRYAMNKHHANEIIHGVSMMAITASQQLIIHGDFSLNEFGENVAGYAYTFDTDHSKQEDDFSVTVQGVSEGVCRQIMSMEWNLPHDIEVNGVPSGECGETNDISFVFTDELGGYWEEMTIGYCDAYSCINCAMDETPLCTSIISDYSHPCICVPKGETAFCGKYECISCPEGETPKCSESRGENACVCVAEGETSLCTSRRCITCPAGETPKCATFSSYVSDLPENACICVPEGETVVCGNTKCFVVPEGQSAACPSSSDDCVFCSDGETAKCAPYGSEEDACVCITKGGKSACNSYHCISCSADETAWCSTYGACNCAAKGERNACGYYDCISCPAKETATCSKYGQGENACVCVPEGKTAICKDYGCTVELEGETSSCNNKTCISCPAGETPLCSASGSHDTACTCVAENETSLCSDKACISCPAGETPLCSTKGTDRNACVCVAEDETAHCGDYGCISCPAGETPSCAASGEKDACSCVPAGETNACSKYRCITCPTGETAQCSSNGSGENACVCVPAGKTAVCGYGECIIISDSETAACVSDSVSGGCISCPAGETAKCSKKGGGENPCICIAKGESGICSYHACITCPAGETPKCSSSVGSAVNTCICVPKGEKAACNYTDCISCPAGETPKCSGTGISDIPCVCIPDGETVVCNDNSCVSCPEGQVGVCKEFGCACYNEGRCESGELMANDATCYPCNTESAIATTENECGLCGGTDSPRVYYNGSCYPDCRTKEKPLMNSSVTCYACDATSAIATDEVNCSACDGTDTPRVMENGKCVLKNCPVVDGEVYVKSSTGACSKCSAATIRSSDAAHLETCRAAGYPRFTNAAGTISYLCTRAGISSSNAGVCHACNFEGTTSYRFMGTNGYCYPCSQTGSVATTAEECAQCGAMRTYDSSAKTCLLAS